jgi:hypothetical protein
MEIKLEKQNNRLVVKRANGAKIYDESQLLHHIKLELKKQGFDVIKKRMYKDGRLVDDNQFYLRDRKSKFYIYDQAFAVRNLAADYNNDEQVCLTCKQF